MQGATELISKQVLLYAWKKYVTISKPPSFRARKRNGRCSPCLGANEARNDPSVVTNA